MELGLVMDEVLYMIAFSGNGIYIHTPIYLNLFIPFMFYGSNRKRGGSQNINTCDCVAVHAYYRRYC